MRADDPYLHAAWHIGRAVHSAARISREWCGWCKMPRCRWYRPGHGISSLPVAPDRFGDFLTAYEEYLEGRLDYADLEPFIIDHSQTRSPSH